MTEVLRRGLGSILLVFAIVLSMTISITFTARPVLAPIGPCINPPSGLISWWPGDGNANDIANGNDGTLQNGATFMSGWVGQAFSFGGVSEAVIVPNNPSLNFGPGEDFSIDAWIQTDNAPGVKTIVEKRQASGNTAQGYTLFLFNGRLGLQMADAFVLGNFMNFISPGPNLADGIFHLVAATVVRDTVGGGNLYVDGNVVFTFSTTDPRVDGDLTNNEPLRIGNHADPGFGESTFDGLIDEVEIFNRALSDSEIQSIFDAGSAGKCKCIDPPPDMVSWWPGDGNADDIQDGNDGTLQNGATFAPGKVGQAFSLDGDDDYVDAGNGANLNIGTGDFTVDFWVLVNDNQWNSILYKYSTGTTSWDKHYRIHAAQTWNPSDDEYVDSIVVTVGDGSGPWYINWQWAEITIGEWQHIAWVLDRDNGSYIYVNGGLESYWQITNNVDISDNGNLTIGTPSDSLNGLIDEVEIFNRALSDSEIQSIFDAGSAGKCKCKPPAGPMEALEDLGDLIATLDPGDFSNPNQQNALINIVNDIINDLDLCDLNSICDAIKRLTKNVLPKTDGKGPPGNPPDWVTNPTAQQQLEDAINDIINALQDEANALGGC